MPKGRPLDCGLTLVFQAAQRGYGKHDISGGSAISVILFRIVFCISQIQRCPSRKTLISIDPATHGLRLAALYEILVAAIFVFINWTGRGLVLSVILATLIIPVGTSAIPLLLASKLSWIGLEGVKIGWLNSERVQIVPWIADGLTIFCSSSISRTCPKN